MKKEEKKITYQFIPTPVVFNFILDANLYKLMNVLINQHNYSNIKGYTKDEYFEISVEKLCKLMDISKKTMVLCLQSLFESGLVDIKSIGGKGKKVCNKFRINFDLIEEYNNDLNNIMDSFNNQEIDTFRNTYYIRTKTKGYPITYNVGEKISSKIEKVGEKSPHIIDTLDILNKKEENSNKNIINKYNNKENISKQELNNKSNIFLKFVDNSINKNNNMIKLNQELTDKSNINFELNNEDFKLTPDTAPDLNHNNKGKELHTSTDKVSETALKQVNRRFVDSSTGKIYSSIGECIKNGVAATNIKQIEVDEDGKEVNNTNISTVSPVTGSPLKDNSSTEGLPIKHNKVSETALKQINTSSERLYDIDGKQMKLEEFTIKPRDEEEMDEVLDYLVSLIKN